MQPVFDFLATPHGIVAAVVFCAFAALALFRAQALAVSERKWCGEVAHWESSLGMSETMTAPWSDLASGDIPSFVGAMKAKIKYLSDATNREKEAVAVLRTLYATPSGKIAIDKACADLAGGASADQIAQDVVGVVAAAPQGPGLGPIAKDLQHAATAAQTIAAKPELAGVIGLLQGVPGIGSLLGPVSQFLDASHAIGVSSTATTAPSTSTTAAAPAPPQTAQVTLPAGHTATVTNTAAPNSTPAASS